MKGYTSYLGDFAHYMENARFPHPVFDQTAKKLIIRDGYFNFFVPLGMLLSFCEDYKYVVINARHELIFDTNAQRQQLHCGRSSDRERNLNCSRYASRYVK